jgi:hypothetical protein
MSQRTAILSTLITHIAAGTASTGSRGMKFIHEVNSFPSFYIQPQNESRIHEGDGGAYAMLSLSIRGYQYSDNIDDLETFMRQIEVAIQTYAVAYSNLVEDARVNSVRTDEGRMSPYGIVDMQLEILYSIDYLYGMTPAITAVRADSTKIRADRTFYTVDRG